MKTLEEIRDTATVVLKLGKVVSNYITRSSPRTSEKLFENDLTTNMNPIICCNKSFAHWVFDTPKKYCQLRVVILAR